MEESTSKDREAVATNLRRATPYSFDELGANELGGKGATSDAALGVHKGDLVLVPAALGRGRIGAHAASCAAYVEKHSCVVGWSPEPVYDDSMQKLIFSIGGLTKEFPSYYARDEPIPDGPPPVVSRHAALEAVVWDVMNCIVTANGQKPPHKRSTLKKAVKMSYHGTLCVYTNQAPRRQRPRGPRARHRKLEHLRARLVLAHHHPA